MKTAGLTYSKEFIGSGDRLLYTDANGRVRPFVGVPTHFHNTNSQSVEGFVPAGGTNYDKVWKTDGSGNPGWRSEASVGAHTHVMADVTDLAAALAGKASSSHGHAESDITNLVTDLAGKAASTHTHAQSDITSLVSDLAGKAASSHTHLMASITDLAAALAGKAASSHGHAESDITNLVSDLAGKAASSHTHALSSNTGTLAASQISGTATNGYVAKVVGGVPTWAAESGGGGGGTVTSVSMTVPAGFSVGITNASTTPAIAVTFGPATGTDVFLGNNSATNQPAFRNLVALDIKSGTFPAERVATGTATNGYIIKSVSGVPTWSAP